MRSGARPGVRRGSLQPPLPAPGKGPAFLPGGGQVSLARRPQIRVGPGPFMVAPPRIRGPSGRSPRSARPVAAVVVVGPPDLPRLGGPAGGGFAGPAPAVGGLQGGGKGAPREEGGQGPPPPP